MTVQLADVCPRITVGHVGPMIGEYLDEGIPFLRSQNIKPFTLEMSGIKFVSEDFHRQLKKSALEPGDVAIVRTGYPGTAAVIPSSLEAANCADLVVVTPGPQLNPHYLALLLNSTWGASAVQGRLVGAAQQHFNVSAAKAMTVSLPPRRLQDLIASILSAYTELIENNSRRIEILEEMAQAIYREWFVEFRYPGHEDVPLVDSEIGPIPEGWELKAFSDVAEFINGFAFKPTHLGAEGIPVVKIKELKNGIGRDSPRSVFPDVPDKYLIDDGDILFSWSADLDAYVWAGGRAWLNQHLFVVRSKGEVSKFFLFHSLLGRMGEFRSRSQGTTMKHIKRSALSEVKMLQPTEQIMRKFEEIAAPLHDLILNLTQGTRNLRETRDLLLPKLISGEIDVSDLDIELADSVA